jgi:hypothetical protein
LNIAIVGDGIAGRTLHRLLKAQAMAVELFGERKKTHCRIRSCGFGTSAACVDFVRRLGIAPEEYVVSRHPGITIAGRRIPGDIYSIDKPRLLAALSADVRYDPPSLDQYDLVVDATGVRRAVAPPIPAAADKIAAGYQYRTRIEGRPLLSFDPIKGGSHRRRLSGPAASRGGGPYPSVPAPASARQGNLLVFGGTAGFRPPLSPGLRERGHGG